MRRIPCALVLAATLPLIRPHGTAGEPSQDASRPVAATQPGPNQSEQADLELEVQAFLEHYHQTLESRDADGVRGLYVDGGRLTWFTDGALAYTSRAGVLEGLRGLAGTEFRTRMDDLRVRALSARHASAAFSFETSMSFPDGNRRTFGGVITMLLERADPTAPWQVLQGHTSTPGGPPGRQSER